MGFDPGVSGAFGVIDIRPEGWRGFVGRLPAEIRTINGKEKRRLVDDKVAAVVRWFQPDEVVSEAVTASPQMGVTSSFTFGDTFGLIRGIALGTGAKMETVRPQKWKSDLRVPANKKLSMARASYFMPALAHLWPLMKHHDLAEAGMITLWAALKHSKHMATLIEWEEARAYFEALGGSVVPHKAKPTRRAKR